MKNRLMMAGIVLAVLGGIALAVETISWTEQETVLDVGPLQAEATVEEQVVVPEALAGGVLAAGLVLLTIGATREGR